MRIVSGDQSPLSSSAVSCGEGVASVAGCAAGAAGTSLAAGAGVAGAVAAGAAGVSNVAAGAAGASAGVAPMMPRSPSSLAVDIRVAYIAMPRLIAKKIAARMAVDLERKLDAPRAPNTVAEAPAPKPEP